MTNNTVLVLLNVGSKGDCSQLGHLLWREPMPVRWILALKARLNRVRLGMARLG